METPLITVVLPIYNVEKYLDRCLNSIVNQTYRNLEIILVDDGSPDNCPQMCEQWAQKDRRIRVIHKQNAGLGMARNSGIEAATGAYISFVDSDDYLDVTAIEKAYTALAEKDAEVAVFGLKRINTYGEPVKTIIPAAQQDCFRDEEVQSQFLPDFIDPQHLQTKNKNLCLSAWSALFSMELVKRTGWRFVSEREMISEDSYSLIWLYRYVRSVVILPEALYFYCENGSSLTQTYRADRFEKIKGFYTACTEMAARQGFGRDIQVRISGLFLSFTIAAMKQIVSADMPRKTHKAILSEIIGDETTQSILKDPQCQYCGWMRKILFWAMRRQLGGVVYTLVKLQLYRDRRK